MSKLNLTKKVIGEAEPHSIIKEGVTTDDEHGLNMTGSGENLRYIIFRGGIADWCIYTHRTEFPASYIQAHGNKPHSRDFIENIVSFNEEVWEMYRH